MTVVIPTLDEECHVARCLRSVRWAARKYVVDCGSGDRTREIAEAEGAIVLQHEWSGYSAQKNWALDTIPFETEWVFFLDADEVATPELLDAVHTALSSTPSADGFYVNRTLMFLGRRMEHAWWYPDRVLRLFRADKGRFDSRSVHERVILTGRAGVLDVDLMHDNRKGLFAFVERHNRYSSLEARELVDPLRRGRHGAIKPDFFGDPAQRRRALKELIWWRLPLLTRPLVRFIYMYVWRRGFLDGLEGLIFCLLIAAHDLHIDAKIVELRINARNG